MTVDLGSDRLDANRIAARHERLAENLRLLYVAVTRAMKKCYMVYGRIRTAETSAMAYLFHLPETADAVDVVAAMKHRIGAMDDSDLLDDLRRLAKRSQGTISIERLPERREKLRQSIPAAGKALRCPVFSGKIESDFKISSFSSMVSRRTQDVGLPDHDIDIRLPAPSPDEPVSPPQQAERAADGRTIFSFPRGARAGIFFHDLLEYLDFSPASEPDRAADISAKLKQYGYEPGWQGAVRQAVDDLLHVRMPSGSEQVCLSNVSGADRVNEMEFYFPQKPVSPQQLGRIFSRHAGSVMPAGFRDRVQNLSFSPAAGFLMGYVDMMFRHGDRFYLLDWKSNYLGQRREDYSAAHLAETMVSEHYILQYCLYTVAANRYLQLHWPDYTYSRHFGGVFYVFIRGVNAAAGADCGIYHDRPHPGLIQALDDALVER